MATTLTKNLKLRVNSNLTADAKFNLERLDQLGATFNLDLTQSLRLRSKQDILILPQDESIGGSPSVGGELLVGTPDKPLDAVRLRSDDTQLTGTLSLKDQNSNFYASISVQDSLTANRELFLSLLDEDREIELGGNLSLGADFSTSGGNIELAAPGNGTWTLPNGPATLVASGEISNADIAADAQIARSKLASGSASHVLINDTNGVASSEAQLAVPRGGTGASTVQGARTALLPSQSGNAGRVLTTNGTDVTWEPAGNGTVQSVGLSMPGIFNVTGSPVTETGTLSASLTTQAAGAVFAGPAGGPASEPTFRALAATDIPQLDHGGLAGLTDDDHTQYHTDTRALSWLGSRTADDLPDGATNRYYSETLFDASLATKDTDDLPQGATNLYYTDSAVDARISLQKGAANGIAELDAGGKVPVSQLPNSIMEYLGTWDASTNTPTLANGTGNAGDVYIVSAPGTVDFGAGPIAFLAGDWVVYSGSIWQKSINSNAVASVQGQTGAVSLDTDDIPEGSTNLYYTDAAVDARIATNKFAIDWTDANPSSITVAHNLNDLDVSWNIYDKATGEEIWPDEAIRTDVNNMQFTTSESPPVTSWRIIIRK